MSFTKALFLVAAGGTAYATVQAGLWGDGYDSRAKLNSIKSFMKGEIDYRQNQSNKETTPPNDVRRYFSSVLHGVDSTHNYTQQSIKYALSRTWNNGLNRTVRFLAGQTSSSSLSMSFETVSDKLSNVAIAIKEWWEK